MPAYLAFKSVVAPSDCDFLGHMNVSKYFAACSDSVFALQAEMGLTREDMSGGRKLSFAVVHATSDFQSELSAGEAIQMETEVLEVGAKTVTFRHTLKKAANGEVAFVTVFKCVLLNLTSRSAAELPQEIAEKAKLWMVET